MNRALKILFTHGYFIKEDEKEQKIMKPYPPLGILYLSAWLDRFDVDNDVYDTTFSDLNTCEEYLNGNSYDIIALYTNLMTKLNVIRLVKYIKTTNKDTLIVLGGPDVTYNVEDYLDTGADVIVIGEGEQTMLEIAKSYAETPIKEFAHIDGVAYRDKDGDIHKTNGRERIRPVDDLPFPNRHKINMQDYLDTWKTHHGKSAMTMSTQRGCPYTCKWCSTAVYGQSYRRRSPELVANEMLSLKQKYNPDSIWFVDDVFTVSHKWIEAFANALKEQGAGIPFECITRADRMNDEVIHWLKEAGCFRVWIGAESGSQKVIDLMDRRVDVNQVREMIRQTRKQGMEAGTFIMLGYPGETEEDIIETVEHLKQSNPDFFTITIAYPIKGTSLYQEVEAKQTKTLDWQQSTDRDRDFERAYSRKYYDYAVRWVTNEVNAFKNKNGKSSSNLQFYKLKFKSRILKSLMYYERTFAKN